MTKIKILGDRIIFDGHADTKHECETITLMCDNLAKSIDFKTIKYESGYAEFERIGGTNDLMFAPAMYNLTINFDSNVEQVVVNTQGGTITCTESGSMYDNMTYYFNSTSNPPTFTVTFKSGYILNTVDVEDNDMGGSVTITSDNTFTGSNICIEGDATINITSKQQASKQTIDVSTLSGWEALASGEHSITVKTKASGYVDSAVSNAVTVSKAASGYSVTVNLLADSYGVNIYDGASSSGMLLGTMDNGEGSKTVTCSSGNLYLDSNSFFGAYTGTSTVVTGGVTIVSEGQWYYNGTFKVTADGTITTEILCLIEGTQITLADGSTKAVEDITYNDELLVWNFYEGKFDKAKPTWIKVEQIAPRYNLVKFSNGAEVGFVGMGGDKGYHRIFNKEKGAFTYTGNLKETPNGTTTFAEDNTFPTVVSQEIVNKEVKFYNVITDKHYNLFANGILTSCKLSNKYRIKNMKYVGDKLISDKEEVAYFKAKDKLRK